jgi:hypothetical protein
MRRQPVIQLAAHCGIRTGQQHRQLTEQQREAFSARFDQRLRTETAQRGVFVLFVLNLAVSPQSLYEGRPGFVNI